MVHWLVLIEFVIRYALHKMDDMKVKLQPSVTLHLILKSNVFLMNCAV